MQIAPIVLFVYNRPWHTKQTIEALKKNELAAQSELLIYSDAPKNDSAFEKVKEVREYIKTIDGFKKVTIVERDKNLGLANSIIDGVTKIVNEHGKIIVLEDDLVTSPYFLKFMNNALSIYENDKKVWHISGYTPPFNKVELSSHFFINPTSCWGWATWNDRWAHFKKDANYFLKKFTHEDIYNFNIYNSYPYYSHIVMNYEGKVNTWAIFWYATVYLNNGLSLHPLNSFVNNIGHDNSGTNCSESCRFDVQLETSYNSSLFSDIVALNIQASLQLAKYYHNLKQPFYIKVINKLKKFLKKDKI